jgi:hypothetical protein
MFALLSNFAHRLYEPWIFQMLENFYSTATREIMQYLKVDLLVAPSELGLQLNWQFPQTKYT